MKPAFFDRLTSSFWASRVSGLLGCQSGPRVSEPRPLGTARDALLLKRNPLCGPTRCDSESRGPTAALGDPIGFLGLVLLWLCLPCRPAIAADKPLPPLPTQHQTRDIEGWTVRVDERLLAPDHRAIGDRALKLLTARLVCLAAVMPEKSLVKLRTLHIQIDLTHGKLWNMQYHPSAQWLTNNGYSASLEKWVHIPDAKHFLSPFENHRQPSAVLHEMAHAYHDQVLGFDEPRIKAAWRKFRDSGKYKSVLTSPGGEREHYALTDHKEFFAEMTESYLAVNDFFPFVAGELQREEPEIFHLLSDIWGPLPDRDGASR